MHILIAFYTCTYIYIHTHIQLSSNEDFSLFSIDCDNDAELAILGAYFKIAQRLYKLKEFLGKYEMCGKHYLRPLQWWESYESDYYKEIDYFHSVVKERYFNVEA